MLALLFLTVKLNESIIMSLKVSSSSSGYQFKIVAVVKYVSISHLVESIRFNNYLTSDVTVGDNTNSGTR